jgi:hypothetical protein
MAEFEVVVAAGLTLKNLLVEGRYSAGLTDTADMTMIMAPVHNRAFAVLGGVRS